jgi:Flp pilus assembly protein TadD
MTCAPSGSVEVKNLRMSKAGGSSIMRNTVVLVPVVALLLAAGAGSALGQAVTAGVDGKVTLTGNPLPEAQVILINPENGKTYKTKTDKKGEFHLIGVQLGSYEVVVNAKTGECLYKNSTTFGQTGSDASILTVMIKEPGEGCGQAGQSGKPVQKGKLTKEQLEAQKAEQAKTDATNALLAQAREALAQKNWPAAETALQEVLKRESDHWEIYLALGGAQYSQGKFQEAAQTYDTGIQKAEKTLPDPKNPFSEPAQVKTGISQMLNQEGNSYLRLGKTDEAVKAYTKAAESSPNPATAYYNLCSALFSMNRGHEALSACDKALAADPIKADAYFIKGSILVAAGRLDSSGKRFVTADAVDALKKYLELAPTGSHAADAKQMLDKCVVGT